MASVPESATFSPLIITEISPATKDSGSQEFIEIYNQSTEAIKLEDQKWQLQITTSKATSWDKAKTVDLSGTVYPGAYILLASDYVKAGEQKAYLHEYAWAAFGAGLTNTAGHVRLVWEKTAQTSEAADTVEWTIPDKNGGLVSVGISSEAVHLEASLPSGSSLKRITTNAGVFTNAFKVSSCPSPTASNDSNILQVSTTGPLATDIDQEDPFCEAIEEEDTSEAGTEVIPAKTEPPAKLLPATIVTPKAKAGPTIPASNKGLPAPRITELLPNPAAPQTDAADEFIELYNENDKAFDLSGYALVVGSTGSKKYTFPKGAVLKPRSFTAFRSSQTRASLSNASGKVALIDPLGQTLSATSAYATAKEGQAWAYAQGKWQWTTKPTPNSENAIAAPAMQAPKTSTAPKTFGGMATTPTSTGSAPAPAMTTASEAKSDSPIHPAALVAVAVFAVLYGAYEYRHDLANQIFKLRSYRAARRKARQGAEG